MNREHEESIIEERQLWALPLWPRVAYRDRRGATWLWAQDSPPVPVFKSKVDLVVLSFTVTDSKGSTSTG